MTSIPERAQMKLFIMPGIWASVGFVLFMIGLASFGGSGFGKGWPEPLILLCIVALLSPFWVGLYLDTKTRRAKLQRALESEGLVRVERDELDPALQHLGSSLKPHPLKPESFKLSLTGMINEHEVVLSKHTVGHGRYKQHLTSCAVWTPIKIPAMTVRPKRLRSKFKQQTVLEHDPFNKQREIICEDKERACTLLSPFADWFLVQKPKSMSFTIHPTPGLVEQWVFEDHWIMLVEQGRSTPDSMLKMARFTTAFVHILETHAIELEQSAAQE